MNDWVVESPSFEEQLMNNRIVYLNQKGINEVVELIKKKDKEIEKLKKAGKEALDTLESATYKNINLINEVDRLNNVIANMEEELMTLYLDIMEYNEDYAKREIKKLKGEDKE